MLYYTLIFNFCRFLGIYKYATLFILHFVYNLRTGYNLLVVAFFHIQIEQFCFNSDKERKIGTISA